VHEFKILVKIGNRVEQCKVFIICLWINVAGSLKNLLHNMVSAAVNHFFGIKQDDKYPRFVFSKPLLK